MINNATSKTLVSPDVSRAAQIKSIRKSEKESHPQRAVKWSLTPADTATGTIPADKDTSFKITDKRLQCLEPYLASLPDSAFKPMILESSSILLS